MPGTVTMEREDPIEASEYVLGLMDPKERRAFELALLDDPDLAAEVWRAENAFAPLATAMPAREPPKRVLRNLEKQLFPEEAAGPARSPRMAVAFWRSVSTFLGLAAVTASAVVAILLIRPDVLVTPQPPLVAAIVSEAGIVTLARVKADGSIIAEPFSIDMPENRDPELWIIFEGQAPQSLGLLRPDEPETFVIDAALPAARQGARLVVTDEPKGGSPSGDPTGPAIAQGPLRRI